MMVFADTSALFALLVRDDVMHVRAKQNFAHFAAQKARLLTSSFVLVETVALLQRRIGLNAVRDFNGRIMPLLEVIWVDAEWESKAMQRLLTQNQKSLSLVDCMSFEIMEAREITEAFSFDRHFEENGFTISEYHGLSSGN
ncbi:MAG: PIN domain-containing protein [Deltaproteobacteria bacterium]|nr:PIN domain-containing protein [Deltaproteobacteria bacterium]